MGCWLKAAADWELGIGRGAAASKSNKSGKSIGENDGWCKGFRSGVWSDSFFVEERNSSPSV